MKQKPSHQFYMQDFLSSPDVQMMNAEEVGCYTLLLFNLYVNGGQIENDAMALPMLCRGTKPSQKVMKKFYEDNGFLKHKRVDEELKKLAKFSKSQSNNARKRWTKATEDSMPSHSHRNAKVDASAIPSECPRGVSSSTSSSIKKINKKKILEFVFLTETELQTLNEKLGKARADEYLARLNNYIGSTGKRYKSHYHTILNWINKDPPTKTTSIKNLNTL